MGEDQRLRLPRVLGQEQGGRQGGLRDGHQGRAPETKEKETLYFPLSSIKSWCEEEKEKQVHHLLRRLQTSPPSLPPSLIRLSSEDCLTRKRKPTFYFTTHQNRKIPLLLFRREAALSFCFS